MRIGQVAKLTGATPKAIRHYEAIGLLDAVPRRGSYRSYTASEVALITLIKQAQALGFRLSEVGSLKAAGGAPDWSMIAALIADKRKSLADEMARLAALERQLATLQQELVACLSGAATPDGAANPDERIERQAPEAARCA